MFMSEKKLDWWEYLRFVTPIFVTIALFLISGVKSDVKDIGDDVKKVDSKIFTHLTNDEIHAPRTLFVTKAEFDLACKLEENNINHIKGSIDDIKGSIDDIKVLLLEDRKILKNKT
jgi:hypothetical protein